MRYQPSLQLPRWMGSARRATIAPDEVGGAGVPGGGGAGCGAAAAMAIGSGRASSSPGQLVSAGARRIAKKSSAREPMRGGYQRGAGPAKFDANLRRCALASTL